MLRDYNFRDVLRREVDRVALPPEDEWLPKASTGSGVSSLLAAALGAIVIVGVIAAAVSTRLAESPAAQEPARVTPPSRPTAVGSIRDVPLPSMYRNTQFHYNLVIPAWFHDTPALADGTSVPGLLDRVVFTARDDADAARFAGTQFRPWDLIVEVYQREGRSLEQVASALGCNRSGPAGASTCALVPTQLRGAAAVVGTRTSPLAGKIYVVDRGDRVLVLRYALGDETNRPADVTEATLEQIISSLGLP